MAGILAWSFTGISQPLQLRRRGPRLAGRSSFAALLLTLSCVACSPSEAIERTPDRKSSDTDPVFEPVRVAPAPPEPAARCETERQRVLQLPALPGAPRFEAARTLIFGHAKAEPVLFARAPEWAASDDVAVRRYRRSVERASYPWDVVRSIVPRFLDHPEHGREVLLRDGYLYADTPELAFALVDHVRAQHLFDDERIFIQRGGSTLLATRTEDGKYRYTNGPEAGKTVRLLLLDRVGTGTPKPALHRDFRTLAYALHFDAARIVHLTERQIVADLRYGDTWVRSVLATTGAKVELNCEIASGEAASRLREFRARAAHKQALLQPLRAAMIASIEERIPFDEPLTEYGQQDGQLRQRWLRAYLDGRDSYRVNGDRYAVFDAQGRPRPPQVCIDFLYDTFERASGTWWQPRGSNRERIHGRVDFGAFTDTTLRRADRFIEVAREDGARFEVHELSTQERVPMFRRQAFFERLTSDALNYQPGDIVVIRGYTPFERPWQRRVMHYHTFFIYERDPLSGMPIALVGNPGHPSIRTWFFEGLRTPKRSIWYRVRPRLAWLETAMDGHALGKSVSPPPLSIGWDV